MNWIGGLAVIVLIVLWFVTSNRFYRKIFDDQHFVEFADRLVSVKAAAGENIEQLDSNGLIIQEHHCALHTSVGLVLIYSITQVPTGFMHHYSVSVPGRYTEGAIGETFSLYAAYLMDFKVEQLTLARSETPVFHTEFTLTPDEQAAFLQRSVLVPTLDVIPTIRVEIRRWADRVRRGRLNREGQFESVATPEPPEDD